MIEKELMQPIVIKCVTELPMELEYSKFHKWEIGGRRVSNYEINPDLRVTIDAYIIKELLDTRNLGIELDPNFIPLLISVITTSYITMQGMVVIGYFVLMVFDPGGKE